MKKNRIVGLFLLLAMLTSLWAVPAAAVGAETAQPPAVSAGDTPTETPPSSDGAENEGSEEPEKEENKEPSSPEEPAMTADAASAVILSPAIVADSSFSLNATAAILVDLNSDSILYEQNADQRVYPASLTKVMTCMLALEHGTLTDTITVSETALENLDEAGSTAGLQAGETLTLEELLYCIMVSSANEACNAVAEYVSGNIEDFVALMNARAAELGCTGTHFANTHGLHDDNHYTTARDLAIIARNALQNSEFVTVCTTTKHTVPATNLSEPRTLHTTNYLISDEIINNYYWSKAKGVKTGFTSSAGRCLITTVQEGDLYLLSVVTGAESYLQDNGDIYYGSFPESRSLLEYGLRNYSSATLLSRLEPLAQVKVKYAADTDTVVLVPESDVIRVLPTGYDKALVERQITYDNPDNVEAPVKAGDKLGSVSVTYDGQEIAVVPLVANADVARSPAAVLKEKLKHLWFIPVILILIVLYLLLMAALRARDRRRKAARRRARERKRMEERRTGRHDDLE